MNKKLLLGLLALAAAHSAAQAQSRMAPPAGMRDRTIHHISRDRALPNDVPLRRAPQAPAANVNRVSRVASVAPWGTAVGISWYDLMTNNSTYDRIKHDENGNTVSMVWTQSCTDGSANAAWPRRGVGYNYFDGNTWLYGGSGNCPSQFGITSVRTGFPSLEVTSGQEIVVAHTGAGMAVTKRPKGTGSWSSTVTIPQSVNIDGANADANATWPRTASVGNTIHMIHASGWQGAGANHPGSNVISPMFYWRSLDAGVTWDIENLQLPEIDSVNFSSIGGDSYAISANGQYVSIVAGGFFQSLKVWMSSDNGTTWRVKTLANRKIGPSDLYVENPAIPNPTGDTVSLRTDGNFDLSVDANGVTHLTTGLWAGIVERNGAGARALSGSYFDLGLGYWNSGALMNSQMLAVAGIDPYYDPLYSQFTGFARSNGAAPNDNDPYRSGGNVSMPTTSIDANGNLYVIYAGVVRGASNTGDSTGQPFRDLYLMKANGTGGNVTWSNPICISRTKGSVANAGGAALNLYESVYPSASPMIHSDNKIHYMWMSDDEPGTSLSYTTAGNDADAARENTIMYDNIDLGATTFDPQQDQPLVDNQQFVAVNPTTVGIKSDATAYVASLNAAPNPTTGVTTLSLNLKQAANATVIVRNTLGQEVMRVAAGNLQTGFNTIKLDLSGQSAGVYFYTVAADKFTLTKRVVKN